MPGRRRAAARTDTEEKAGSSILRTLRQSGERAVCGEEEEEGAGVMIDKAWRVIINMSEAFDAFEKMEMPIEKRECTLNYEAVTAIINGFQQLASERDAAVEAIPPMCILCKNNPLDFDETRGVCMTCTRQNKWQWRGVQEVKNEKTNENTGRD